MRIRLSDEDRERLGVGEEWISFHTDKLMMRDAEALETAGYDVDEFLEDIRGRPVLRNGEPVMVPDVDEDDNEILDGNGQPTLVPKIRRSTRALRALAWLALRSANVQVPYDEFDCNLVGIAFAGDDEDGPGKDQPATTGQPSGT